MTTFQNKPLPSSCSLVGFSWLIEHFEIRVPLRELSSVSQKRLTSQRIQNGAWVEFDAQFKIEQTPYAHLEFAIKHESLDLLVLKYILKSFPPQELTQNIKANPKRILNKKIWFFYEFLLETRLPIDDLPTGRYDNLLSPKRYITRNRPIKSQRHKINNNLLGTANLCPIIQRTKKLQEYILSDLTKEISDTITQSSKSLIRSL
jgi:hypothetical protein